MKKIIFIGTLHAGLTPKKELGNILKKIKPSQVLVEIRNQDIKAGNISSYPDEMIYALRWSNQNNIPVYGFDSGINVVKNKITEKEQQLILRKQKRVVKKYRWSDFNKDIYHKLLDSEESKSLIDFQKWRRREEAMVKNLRGYLVRSGKTVILTGAGHLPFFEKIFKKAKFPFRY